MKIIKVNGEVTQKFPEDHIRLADWYDFFTTPPVYEDSFYTGDLPLFKGIHLTKKIRDYLVKNNFKLIRYSKSFNGIFTAYKKDDKILLNTSFAKIRNENNDSWYISIQFKSSSFENIDLNFFKEFVKINRVKKARPEILIVYHNKYNYTSNKKQLNKIHHIDSEDIKLFYGEEFSNKKYPDILEHISNNKNGIILLHGIAGSGKTTLIKHFIEKFYKKTKFLFFSTELAQTLDNPELINFVTDFKKCCIIIEDAEKIIRKRNLIDSPGLSSLLNISDGILSNMVSVPIILTFNSDLEKIDEAVLRNNRLIVKHDFNKIDSITANKIAKKHKLDKTFDSSVTIADIFTNHDNTEKFDIADQIL